MANKNVDAEIVRQITSILYERRQDLAAIVSVASYISPPTSLSGTNLPIHPGAQAYYDREKPSFLQSNADYLGFILTLVLLIGSWVWNLKLRIEQRQKNTGDGYNQKLIQLIEEIYQSDMNRVGEIRQELFTMLKEVVQELDEDRIAPESFQSFTFTWEAAVRDREILISRQAAARK